jgi:hypothetical protein
MEYIMDLRTHFQKNILIIWYLVVFTMDSDYKPLLLFLVPALIVALTASRLRTCY